MEEPQKGKDIGLELFCKMLVALDRLLQVFHQFPILGFYQGVEEIFLVLVIFVDRPLARICDLDDFIQGRLGIAFMREYFFRGFQDPFFLGKRRIDFHHTCLFLQICTVLSYIISSFRHNLLHSSQNSWFP